MYESSNLGGVTRKLRVILTTAVKCFVISNALGGHLVILKFFPLSSSFQRASPALQLTAPTSTLAFTTRQTLQSSFEEQIIMFRRILAPLWITATHRRLLSSQYLAKRAQKLSELSATVPELIQQVRVYYFLASRPSCSSGSAASAAGFR
jgi:hypothetical protein